jgi:hypothetical protein
MDYLQSYASLVPKAVDVLTINGTMTVREVDLLCKAYIIRLHPNLRPHSLDYRIDEVIK